MSAKDVALKYFEVSNKSDFDEIAALLTDTTTYSSQTTGLYLGRDDIVAMQKEFHGSFKSLRWDVHSVEETKPGILLFDFTFVAERHDGEAIESDGLEYVIVADDMIQHIEIRNK